MGRSLARSPLSSSGPDLHLWGHSCFYFTSGLSSCDHDSAKLALLIAKPLPGWEGFRDLQAANLLLTTVLGSMSKAQLNSPAFFSRIALLSLQLQIPRTGRTDVCGEAEGVASLVYFVYSLNSCYSFHLINLRAAHKTVQSF